MELTSPEGPIPLPLPLSSRFIGHDHDHIIHHHHHHNHDSTPPPPPNNNNNSSPLTSIADDHDHQHNNSNGKMIKQQLVKYRECLKNHAASMGGNATDGCGEFMPSGDQGSLEALTCSACNCHRNFHRKEIDGEPSSCTDWPFHGRVGRKLIVAGGGVVHHKPAAGPEPAAFGYPTPTGTYISSRNTPHPHPQPHHMIMSYNMGMGMGMGMGSLHSESDDQDEGNNNIGGGSGVMMARSGSGQMVKKRFRTKFTGEQKEKMLEFAERVGWKIQKQEESVVQQFCQEIGVKRRVLKVWMHNNKHNLAKKDHDINLTASPNSPSPMPLNSI